MPDGSSPIREAAALKANSREFRSALSLVAKATVKKSRIPILSYVRLRADRGALTFSATNLDTEITTSIAGVGTPVMDLMLPPSILMHIAKCGEEVSLSRDGEETVAKCGPATIRIGPDSTLPVEDMPARSDRQWRLLAEIGEGEFAEWLRLVSGAVSTEETRFYLNGIHFNSVKGKLRLEATDGHRLYMLATGREWDDAPRIVPRDALPLINSAINAKGNGSVRIYAPKDGANFVRIDAPSAKIITKLVDGTFPDVMRVVPENPGDISAKLTKAIVGSLIRPIGGRFGEYAGVSVDAAQGIMSQRSAQGIHSTVSIEQIPGAVKFGVNAKYLRDLTTTFGDVAIRATGPGDPLAIQTDDERLTVIVMPMRV